MTNRGQKKRPFPAERPLCWEVPAGSDYTFDKFKTSPSSVRQLIICPIPTLHTTAPARKSGPLPAELLPAFDRGEPPDQPAEQGGHGQRKQHGKGGHDPPDGGEGGGELGRGAGRHVSRQGDIRQAERSGHHRVGGLDEDPQAGIGGQRAGEAEHFQVVGGGGGSGGDRRPPSYHTTAARQRRFSRESAYFSKGYQIWVPGRQ